MRSAGTSPNSNPVNTDSASEKSSTRPSIATSSVRGSWPRLSNSKNRVPNQAMTSPSMPPASARTMLSVNSCLTSRPRPAPRAARIATSCWREPARASSRLATLTHAMSNTNATAPRRTSNAVRTLPTIASCSGATVAPSQFLSSRYSSASRRVIPAISARACSIVAPGLRRATTSRIRTGRMRGMAWSGIVEYGMNTSTRSDGKLNDGGITPTT